MQMGSNHAAMGLLNQNGAFPPQPQSSDWKSRSLLPRLLYIVQCRNRYRPPDNNVEWWKSYVQEFFAPNGVVRISVKDMPVFQQPHTAIPSTLTCTEVPFEVLPRLFQFKYENGVQEELLFLGNVIESALPSGGTSIICYQAAEHLVFEGYAVIQYGHLKVVFNTNHKVQLLDFSVTGYDLHLDHSVVHTELRQLSATLEERCMAMNQAANQGQLDPKAAQDNLRAAANYIKHYSNKLDQFLSFEWSYIQKVLHFMQMADVITSMHALFCMSSQQRITPREALLRFSEEAKAANVAQPLPQEPLTSQPSGIEQKLQQLSRDMPIHGTPALNHTSPQLSTGGGTHNLLRHLQVSHGSLAESPALSTSGLDSQHHKLMSSSLQTDFPGQAMRPGLPLQGSGLGLSGPSVIPQAMQNLGGGQGHKILLGANHNLLGQNQARLSQLGAAGRPNLTTLFGNFNAQSSGGMQPFSNGMQGVISQAHDTMPPLGDD